MKIMKVVIVALAIVLAIMAVSPAFARIQNVQATPQAPTVGEETELQAMYVNDTGQVQYVPYTLTVGGPVTLLGSTIVLDDQTRIYDTCTQTQDGSSTVISCPQVYAAPGHQVVYLLRVSYPEAGTFTHTATFYPSTGPESANLAVEVLPPPGPQSKADCKNGGFARYGFPNQGTCIEATPGH